MMLTYWDCGVAAAAAARAKPGVYQFVSHCSVKARTADRPHWAGRAPENWLLVSCRYAGGEYWHMQN